jgi:hypothetical protein
MRVPASGGLSLMKAKARGADVRMVYSCADAIRLAGEHRGREVVFFAIGFETTTPPTALAIRQAQALGLRNFTVFCNHVLTPAAITHILESPEVREFGTVPIDGFIGPAHVSTVIGSRPYEYFAQEYRRPVVIAGFGKNTDAGGAGTKRWAQTTIVSSFGNTVNIGGDGVSTCEGDSGSSAFVQLDDGSYRAISMTSTGIGCGQTGVHALMHPAIPWIESEAQIDITPCHDLDGTWHPTGACTGFYAGGETPHGTWPDWCEGTPRSAASDSCGAPFDAVADGDAPLVAFAAPHDGDQLEPGVEIELAIDASDDGWGVQQVWIAIDGAELPNLDEYPPYGFTGVTFPAGVYTLQAFAQDWAGNVGSSTPIMIGVGMPVPADDTGDGSSTAADGSGSSGSDDTAASTDASSGAPLGSSDDTGAAQSDGEGGCGCRTHGGAAAALWLPLLAWLRRRARQPAGGLTTRPNPAPVMSE